MQLRWGALVLLVSTVASADPMTLEAARRDLALEETDERGFHAQGFAQLSGGATDTAEADAAVGGEVRLVGPRCNYLRVGGQARLGWARGRQASAEQWASFCIPTRIMVMEFGHHLEWDVRPSLLAPLQLRAGTNRRETASFHWQPLRMNAHRFMHGLADSSQGGRFLPSLAEPPPGDLVIFEIWTDWMFLWSATTPLAMQQSVDAAGFRYIREHEAPWRERRDFAVDVFRAGGYFNDPADGSAGGTGIQLWLGKLENLKLGPVYANAGFGGSGATAGEFVTVPTNSGEMPRQRREVDVLTPRAMLGVETGNGSVHGQLRATHEATAVVDGYVTVDSRITAGIGLVWPLSKLSLEGTVARTALHVPKAMIEKGVTGGASLSAAHRLSKHLQATLLVDVARSFYAPAATTLDFTPRWGAQVFGAIQATAGR